MIKLTIWASGAWDIVKSIGKSNCGEKIIVIIKGIAVLIILYRGIALRHIIQIIEKGLSDTKFKGNVVFGVKHILHASTKWNRHLYITILCCLLLYSRETK